ncbi:putative 2-ketogluconate kinase [Pseudomonas aeruginosa VRFPA02]|nr:putative 2-ketogluconate kinase [Pseudomonas aeruginosa VRFPA02]
MGVDAVAIKLGPSGAYYRDAHGEGLVPGVPVATVVDTVAPATASRSGWSARCWKACRCPTRWRAATGSAAARYRSAATWRGCRNAANCSTASAAGAPEPAAHAAPVATRTRQAQEIPDHDHASPRQQPLVVHHADRFRHLQPGLPGPRQLRLRRRLRDGRRPADHPRAVLAAGRAVLPRLLLLPGAGGDLRGKAQRQEADLRQPDPLGRTGHPDRDGRQRLSADRHPLPPRRGRGGGDASDAGLPLPLVHPRRALAGEHLPDPRQPGDHPLDVGGLRLPGGAFQLALDVHHRRPAGGDLGLHLVAPGG